MDAEDSSRGVHTRGCAHAKAEGDEAEHCDGPQHEGARRQVEGIHRASWQGLPKVHNHAHGLDQGVEEQLAVLVELVRLAPVAAQMSETRPGTALSTSAYELALLLLNQSTVCLLQLRQGLGFEQWLRADI